MGATCEEEGLVTGKAAGNMVRVTVERGEACGRCEARGACQVLGGQTKDLVIVVENSVGAAEGDTVLISMEESAVLKASAVLYLIPAAGLIGGAAIGYWLAGMNGWDLNGAAALGSLGGLVAGLSISFLTGKKLARGKTFLPKLTSIVSRLESGDGEEGSSLEP